ncbi:DNA polymerase III subunit alpha [bacterium]|nr:DNA polymerase III subunit alpha [bacterium]
MLYVKSYYSLLSSLLSIDDIIDLNIKSGNNYAVICDNNMYGTMEFIKKCNQKEIKPVIGLELVIEDKIILCYAKDYTGYLNLVKLSTKANTSKVELNDINTYKESLIIVISYKDRELLELVTTPLIYLGYKDEQEKNKALEITERVVFLKECLYKEKKDANYLKYLYLIRDGKSIYDEVSYDLLDKEFINDKSCLEIVNKCNITFPKASLLLPIYTCPNNLDADTYLKELAIKGLTKRLKGNVLRNYSDRLLYELSIIKKMGFSNYFLVVYDFILYAKKNNILVGPGRGSAAGSLVAYSLGITEIDPLKYDLLFERFLNPERVSMPDIDTDLPDIYRENVINYVKEKYGEKKVAGIVTFSTMSAKQVLRDITRVLKVPNYKIDRLNSFIPPMSKENLDYYYQHNRLFKSEIDNDKDLKETYLIASRLEGFPRQIGTHAAGIVMCKKNLDEVLPLTMSDGMYLTSYSMNYLEELGLLKMDFLGIKNLTLIMNILKDIEENLHIKIPFYDIPLNDSKCYQLFTRAFTTGIFQFESSGMRKFLRDLKPTNFEDIVAAIALFRPGPASNINTYIRRKEGKEKVIYLDSSLEPILKKTYGIMIYQEQVMQTVSYYAGYTLGEADILRRAISKKKKDVLIEEEERFLRKAKNLGKDENISKELFAQILKFAGYGFNRSHAVAYSMVAYKMAYLKVHYPLYFYTNLLTNVVGVESKLNEYIKEVRSVKIKVEKPLINLSTSMFRVIDGKILFPFSTIKGIGVSVCKTIVNARCEEFTDIFIAIRSLVVKGITKKQLETLILADVFRNFNYNKRTLITNLDSLYNYGELVKDLDPSLVLIPDIEITDEYSNYLLLEQEKKLFGFYISNHPATSYKTTINAISLENLDKYFDKLVPTIVLVENIHEITTKKGDKMAFVTCSDETGSGEYTFFPQVWNNVNIKKGSIYKIVGRVEKRYDQTQIIVSDVLELGE